MSTQHKHDMDDTRRQILTAASARFTQFGYNKTTMAEIAQDCGMSAANLYRYFENKLDLGATLANACLGDKLKLIQAIVDDEGRPAAARLREVVLGILHFSHGMWADNPRINELVNVICEECMALVEEHKQREHALLVKLLQQGVASGEFAVGDPPHTADALMSAITLFCMPLLMPLYSLEIFEQKADAVVQLILDGIRKK